MSESSDISTAAVDFTIKVDGQDLESTLMELISNLSVTKRIDQADSFSFRVQDELNDGQYAWLGSDTFKYGKK
ncbi:MAG: hypothetical protein GY940_12110, partial [bacterium]|nr:hypothetical protein [bacterium]